MSPSGIEWLSPSLPYMRFVPRRPQARMLLAHGAGMPMDHAFMQNLAQALLAQGIEVITFEFPYMARRRTDHKKGFPDKSERLLACWRDVFQHFYTETMPYLIAGKSLGGRMASLFALEQAKARWVVCFGYPFHPVGKPLKLRTEHLARVPGNVLIFQGSRDAFGTRAQVQTYDLGKVKVCWQETCDHDFTPLLKSGLTVDGVMRDMAQRVVSFARLGTAV